MSADRASAHSTLLDRLDLFLLRLAKRRRARLSDSPDFYEQFFENRDLSAYARDLRHLWRFGVMRRTFDRLFPHGDVSVIDVGCGLGTSLLHLPDSCAFVGVDISEATLNAARQIHSERRTSFRHGGFPELPVGSNEFDFAICFEVLEHLADDAQAVSELARVVKPEGLLLVSVPNTYYWPSYRNLIGHYRHYTHASLEALLTDHGFEIVERYPTFRRFWRAYYYVYLVLRIFELLVRRSYRRDYSIYESRLYRRVGRTILRRLESKHDDGSDSTFVLCRNSERMADP